MMNCARLAVSIAAFTLALGYQTQVHAHFVLKAPASFQEQDALGDPQKTVPCGGPGTATGTITNYKPGDTVTISIDETIFHPGHYSVALATNSLSDLPASPTVTKGATACGSVPIQNPPVFPILADGELKHTRAFAGAQTIQVKLPTNVTCKNCVLQVTEFMSSHAAPCFYYHCANISIGAQSDAGTAPPDAGATPPTPPSADASIAADAGKPPGPTPVSRDDSGAVVSETPAAEVVPQPGDGCSTTSSAGLSNGSADANGFGLGMLAVLGCAAIGAARRKLVL